MAEAEGTEVKAFVRDRYGGPEVLELRDVETPTVGDEQVLVRVRAASVNAADWHLMRASPSIVRLSEGLRRPRSAPGLDVAGVVEQVGSGVKHLHVGDEVFGMGGEVTATTGTDKVELVASLGAKEVLDHSREDFTRTGPYDLVVDIGGDRSIGAGRRALAPEGTYVLVGADAGSGGPMKRIVEAAIRSRVLRQRVVFFISWASTDDLLTLKDLLDAGEVRPVIDRTFRFEEVPDAIAHLERGGVAGKVVVTVAE